MFLGRDDIKPYTCVEIMDPNMENTGIMEKILTCSDAFKSVDKIKFINTGEGPLKIYEIKIIGMK